MTSQPLDQPDAATARLLILVGPTASGKTGVAHVLARRHGHRILSADSMMVYRGMDVGTAKPTREEQVTYGYSGLDLAPPNRPFSVADYLAAVGGTVQADAAWLVTGGTGLYVRGLLKGLDASGGPDSALRNEAEACWHAGGIIALKTWCLERLPALEELIPPGDRMNPRRWIRAVERALAGSLAQTPPLLNAERCKVVGLARERTDLETRIRTRVDRMIKEGLLDEVQQLRGTYGDLSETARKAIGYAEVGEVLDGKLRLTDAVERMVIRTRQYAKRQMTWFRNQLNTHWINAEADETDEQVANRVETIWYG